MKNVALVILIGAFSVLTGAAQKPAKKEKKASAETQKTTTTTSMSQPSKPMIETQNPKLENQVLIDVEMLYNKLRQITPSTWNYPGDSIRHYGIPSDELTHVFGMDSKGKMGIDGKLTPEIQTELNLTLIWVLSNKIEELKLENENLRAEIQNLRDSYNMVQSIHNDVMNLQTEVNKFRDYENKILDLATKLTDLINDINTLKQERRY